MTDPSVRNDARGGVDEPRMEAICEGPNVDPEVFRSILARVGDKWSMMLIGMLRRRVRGGSPSSSR